MKIITIDAEGEALLHSCGYGMPLQDLVAFYKSAQKIGPIGVRPVSISALYYLRKGNPTKPFAVKSKSAKAGPMAGLIAIDPRYGRPFVSVLSEEQKKLPSQDLHALIEKQRKEYEEKYRKQIDYSYEHDDPELVKRGRGLKPVNLEITKERMDELRNSLLKGKFDFEQANYKGPNAELIYNMRWNNGEKEMHAVAIQNKEGNFSIFEADQAGKPSLDEKNNYIPIQVMGRSFGLEISEDRMYEVKRLLDEQSQKESQEKEKQKMVDKIDFTKISSRDATEEYEIEWIHNGVTRQAWAIENKETNTFSIVEKDRNNEIIPASQAWQNLMRENGNKIEDLPITADYDLFVICPSYQDIDFGKLDKIPFRVQGVLRASASENRKRVMDSDKWNQCELISMPFPPIKETLDDIPIKSKAAYVRCGTHLFYIHKELNICDEIKIDKNILRAFDNKFSSSAPEFDSSKPKILSRILLDEELAGIAVLTRYPHSGAPEEDFLKGNASERVVKGIGVISEETVLENPSRIQKGKETVHHNAEMGNPFADFLENNLPLFFVLPKPMDLSSMQGIQDMQGIQEDWGNARAVLIETPQELQKLAEKIYEASYYFPKHALYSTYFPILDRLNNLYEKFIEDRIGFLEERLKDKSINLDEDESIKISKELEQLNEKKGESFEQALKGIFEKGKEEKAKLPEQPDEVLSKLAFQRRKSKNIHRSFSLSNISKEDTHPLGGVVEQKPVRTISAKEIKRRRKTGSQSEIHSEQGMRFFMSEEKQNEKELGHSNANITNSAPSTTSTSSTRNPKK